MADAYADAIAAMAPHVVTIGTAAVAVLAAIALFRLGKKLLFGSH